MVNMTVAEMNSRLVELNTFFTDKTQQFSHKISLHEGKITPQDLKDFQKLIKQIQQQSMRRITDFINQRLGQRCQTYEKQIRNYTQTHYEVQNDLNQFSQYLQQSTIELKQEQVRKEFLLEHFTSNSYDLFLRKKTWAAMKSYWQARKNQKAMNQKMDNLYNKNLMKKAFFPWRSLTYKQGYENTVRRQTQADIMNIHDQYRSIIDILKNKIQQTDNLIKVKKAAKGEFSYALSKNLLKTISNLSIEVMSLNQMSLRDQQFANQSTEKFMGDIDDVIREKLERVRDYKREISGQNQENDERQRKKKITFV